MIDHRALISKAYLDTQVALHATRSYGADGSRWAGVVKGIAKQYDCGSVLDYGCGQGSLARALQGCGLSVREYDPAIQGKNDAPVFADMVACTDVLEHIEPDRLDKVLAHIRQLARKVVFLVVSTRWAVKVLRDGRNAHLIVEPGEWWQARVEAAGFTMQPVPDLLVNKKPRKAWIAVVTP